MFRELLEKEGLSSTRAFGLELAMDHLHRELCKLDNNNLRIFLTAGLAARLRQYSKEEGMRNPLADIEDKDVDTKALEMITAWENGTYHNEGQKKAVLQAIVVELIGRQL